MKNAGTARQKEKADQHENLVHFASPLCPNGELSGSESGWRVYSPSPRANGSNDFVRPRESARGRTNRARGSAQLAVRARAARPNAANQPRGFFASAGLALLCDSIFLIQIRIPHHL